MTVREYIGARYVPIFADPIEWDNASSYEPLTVVTHEGGSYVSKRSVPIGIDIENTDYWLLWADYNAQLEQYRQEVADLALTVSGVQSDITDIEEINDSQILVFADIAAMKSCDFLKPGDICKTLCFSQNGLGGAYYLISNVGIANEMDVIACGELFANLVFNPFEIHVSQFGAVDNENDTEAFKRVFNIVPTGGAIFIDVRNAIINEPLTLNKNSVTIKNEDNEDYYGHITFNNIGNNPCIYVNGRACSFIGLSIANGDADDITEITSGIIGIRLLYTEDFMNTDTIIRNCTFIYFAECIQAYGKNIKVQNCLFSNCLCGVHFISKYNNVQTTQCRGWIVEDCVFHGGDENLIKNYNISNLANLEAYPVKGVFAQGACREIVIRNNMFNSDYCGYMYVGHSAGLDLTGNSNEKHTCFIGLCALNYYTGEVTEPGIISNNCITNPDSSYDPTMYFCAAHPIYQIGDTILNIMNNVFSKVPSVLTGSYYNTLMGNNIDLNRYISGLGVVNLSNLASSDAKIFAVGNYINGGAGSTTMFSSENSYSYSFYNSNYADCNFINPVHITI